MTDHRFQRRLFFAVGALALAAIACGPVGGPPPITPTYTPGPPPLLTATATTESPTEACNPPAGPAADWLVYCDEAHGFAFRYPSGGTSPGDGAGHGNIYLPIAAGTNLAEKYISVTATEGATTCESPNAAGYAPGTVPSETVTLNGIDFYKQTGSDAGAGNFYDWVGYSNLHGELCVSVTFVLHSNSPGVFDTPPAEFDKAAESAIFDPIMATFYFFTPGEAAQGPAPIPTAEGSVVNSTDCNPPAATGAQAELVVSAYCNTEFKFGFRYPPVGDAGYVGAGPVALPFEPSGDLVGKYLDVAAARDLIACFAGQEGKSPEELNYQNVVVNNIAYVRTEGVRVSPSTGLYEHWIGYGTSGANVCLIMTFVLESSSETPTFDTAAESAIFQTIMSTFIWYES